MNESSRIFRANSIKAKPEDVYLAINGLAGELTGVVLKSDRSTMHTGEVYVYKKNNHLFSLIDPISGIRENVPYDKVAEVWW